MPVSEARTLKVHIDSNDNLWYMAGETPPRRSRLSLTNFVQETATGMYQAVRMVGSRENARAIVDLYTMKLQGTIPSVQVCSPILVPGGNHKNKAEEHLLTMRCWEGRPASMGGWHEVEEADYYSYLLTTKVRDAAASTDEIKRVLKDHPAWPSLSFILHLDQFQIARLLGLIVDPRWYIDLDKPDKSAKLESFLGLHPKTQFGVSGRGKRWRAHDRCQLVMDTWKTTEYPTIDSVKPSYFLWRVWNHHGGGYMADLRTSQLFIAFLRLVWLDALYRNPRNNKTLFVPQYFFHQQMEYQAYERHMAKTVTMD